eukprot:GEMP01003657.1.p1 GENE.GEMP01003657.1~~GEMP01003657.1.p1  ORF type:complete len:371 (+),score=54.69 GEMP01003657.1:137-1249(+)
MGLCAGKLDAVDSDRRRLSVAKSDPASRDNFPDRGRVAAGNIENLTSLFPQATRRFSLSGAQSTEPQKGFDNKGTASSGEMTISEASPYKIGYACKKGMKPESPNQDDFFILLIDDWCLFGVFDGHGPYGHDISSVVHNLVPSYFVHDTNFPDNPEMAFKNAFLTTHAQCTRQSDQGRFDASLSGTTATCCFLRDDYLYTAHVGDSRCVVGSYVAASGKIVATDISDDHKPSNENEKRRIRNAGGQVRKLQGDVNYRVFLKGKLYPGLAMSRSIGDLMGNSAGVTAEPETSKHKIDDTDRFFILASDGVWEFISSQEAVDIIMKYPRDKVQAAVEDLCQESWKRWIEEEGNIVDDITAICFWVNTKTEET